MTQRLDHALFGRAEVDPHDPPRRRGTHRPPRRRFRGLVTGIVVVALLVVGGVFAFSVFRPMIADWTADKDYSGEGTEPVTITIQPGDTGAAIAANLERHGVIKTTVAFTDALAGTRGDEIQPGTYTLRQQMPAAAALSALRDPASRNVIRVTIREGLWKSETYAELAQAAGLTAADYEAVEKAAAADPTLLGLPASAKGNPEGYLYPATYSFDRSSTPTDQLKKMVGTTTATLGELGVSAEDSQRVLTEASVVEAEAKHPEDRPKAARVIENRLEAGMPLQMDSTSAYGVGDRGKVLTTQQMREANNPYNTYVHSGLPAGPIGNPGRASIEAVLHPADGPWLFFVTIDPSTGETIFTTTKDEHDAQVVRLNQWCAAHPGKC